MKRYKYRGYGWLLAELFVFAFGLVFFLAFNKEDNLHTYAHHYGVAMMILSFAFLPAFFSHRKMSPEQFEKRQKREKQNFDERSFQVACRACRIAEIAGTLSLCVGLIVFAFVLPNRTALWATVGYLTVMILTMLIAHAVYSSKM